MKIRDAEGVANSNGCTGNLKSTLSEEEESSVADLGGARGAIAPPLLVFLLSSITKLIP